MNNFIKILIAGLTALIAFEIPGISSYPILQFGVFIAIFMGIKYLLRDIKILKLFLLTFISIVFFSGIYIWYLLNSAPIEKSFLENHRVQRIMQAYNLKYKSDISNNSYLQLCTQYRKDLRTYYKDSLSSAEKNKIWENYKKIYNLQVKLEKLFIDDIKPFKIVDTILEYRYFPMYIFSMKVTGAIQTYSNNKKGATIPFVYNETPKKKFSFKDYGFGYSVTLPYINNSLPINKSDKKTFELVNKYMDETYQLLRENREYQGIVKMVIKNI